MTTYLASDIYLDPLMIARTEISPARTLGERQGRSHQSPQGTVADCLQPLKGNPLPNG